MKYEFMQLGGNCACIGYLGKNRLKGPVDNVILKTTNLIKLLIENKYYDYLYNNTPTLSKRTPGWDGDSPFFYQYPDVWIAHHNPQQEKYKKELKERIQRFNDFLKQVRETNTHFFTINLNEFMIDKGNHTLKKNTLKEILEYLQKISLLDKVIFISTKLKTKNNPWDYYSDNAYRLLDLFKAKHITIIDNDIWETKESEQQFELKAEDIIEHNSDLIDLVVPYVDCGDPEWQKVFNIYNNASINSRSSNAKNRFRGQGDFFRYFFRCIDLNLPWINRVFLLVQGQSQVPSWINRNKVQIITHSDFIPKQYLPTFNSGTIEMFLYNIPNLSEKFIYTNDDIYMLNYASKQDFFIKDKCVFNYLKDTDAKSNIWRQMCQNNHDLIFKTVKAKPFLRLDHEFRPYLKTKMIECFELHKSKILNSCTRFRESKNLTVYLFSLFLIKNQLQQKGYLNLGYIWSECGNNFLRKILNTKDTVCLNDTSPEIDLCANILVKTYFKNNFKNYCEYEKECVEKYEKYNISKYFLEEDIPNSVSKNIAAKAEAFTGLTEEWWKEQ